MCIYKESVIYYLYFGYFYNISEVDISAADISVVDISVADISGIDISVVDFQLKFVPIYTWLFANDYSAQAPFYIRKFFCLGEKVQTVLLHVFPKNVTLNSNPLYDIFYMI